MWSSYQKWDSDIPGLKVTFQDTVLYATNVPHFGYKVALQDRHLVVTEWNDVYYFVRDGEGWRARQVIHSTSTTGAVTDIDLDGNTLCIGYNIGAFGGHGSGRFGASVALSDDRAVISADMKQKVFIYPLYGE
ncbi:MAG: hypothetical protein R2824_22255 [Saprospiraceae bacterium]|nr:hypothetical protein [Lewinella sp.]